MQLYSRKRRSRPGTATGCRRTRGGLVGKQQALVGQHLGGDVQPLALAACAHAAAKKGAGLPLQARGAGCPKCCFGHDSIRAGSTCVCVCAHAQQCQRVAHSAAPSWQRSAVPPPPRAPPACCPIKPHLTRRAPRRCPQTCLPPWSGPAPPLRLPPAAGGPGACMQAGGAP